MKLLDIYKLNNELSRSKIDSQTEIRQLNKANDELKNKINCLIQMVEKKDEIIRKQLMVINELENQLVPLSDYKLLYQKKSDDAVSIISRANNAVELIQYVGEQLA